jgi:hypothetical protein
LTVTPGSRSLAALGAYEHLFRLPGVQHQAPRGRCRRQHGRRQKGEQFRILESAFAPPAPFSPNRIAIIAVGLLLGIGLGAGVAVLLEALDSSFHGVHQLQAALRLPVLASIPGIVLESDRLAMRRRRIRNAVAAAAVTCVVLAGAIAGNWAVNGVPGFVQTLIAGEEPAAPAAPAAPAGEQG